ncbi:MAG: FAD-dependent oxidoreductase [Candidatus Zixiibacteriota bacterium]|nr:MAG: FAD-dependent oxidoreductase [candidate division Zixibacteria bacterium]
MSDSEKFDCLVVGAGPAGISAALALARAGIQVAVLERGEYPGAKNVMGGILFTTVLNKLLPEFWKQAPVERHVTQRRFSMLSRDGEVALDFRTGAYNEPPYNHTWTVLRSKFDRWFAEQAEAAGVMIVPGMMVSELLVENGKVVGVKTEPGGDELRSDVVISAEGVNSFLAEQVGLRRPHDPRHMAVAVKEVIALPASVIEDRFRISGDEGSAWEVFGQAVQGTFGSGFVYTNKDSISIGVGSTIHDMTRHRLNPNEVLEQFKRHPAIRPLVRGGETLEYAAHMIPEGGFTHLPRMVMDGLILTGDAAGLVNASHYHEGSNLAMASGLYAAETVVEAKRRGDFSAATLSQYANKLEHSFVLQDLRKFQRVSAYFNENPHTLRDYPDVMVRLLSDYFTVSEKPKAEIEKEVIRKFRSEIGVLNLVKDVFKIGRAMR